MVSAYKNDDTQVVTPDPRGWYNLRNADAARKKITCSRLGSVSDLDEHVGRSFEESASVQQHLQRNTRVHRHGLHDTRVKLPIGSK